MRNELLAVLVVVTACRYTGPTRVEGNLVLAAGEVGDLRGAEVWLYDTTGFDTPVLWRSRADSAGFNYRVRFRFPDVAGGDYLLFAWQDCDGSGTVSDGDIAGVLGADYDKRDSALSFHVWDDWTLVEVPDVVMRRIRRVEPTVLAESDSARTTVGFSYRFNHDVLLGSLEIVIPGVGSFPDARAPGLKLADSSYASTGWNLGGAVMPTGWYVLRFRGLFSGDTFAADRAVRLR